MHATPIITIGNNIPVWEIMRGLLNHDSTIIGLLGGGLGIFLAFTNLEAIRGKVGAPDETGKETRKHGLIPLLGKLGSKLFKSGDEEISEEDWLFGLRGLFYASVAITSVPLAIRGVSGTVTWAVDFFEIPIQPNQMIDMVKSIANVITTINDKIGMAAVPLVLAALAITALSKYSDSYRCSEDNPDMSDHDPEDNVVIANTRLMAALMVVVPGTILITTSALGITSMDFIYVGAPLIGVALMAWLFSTKFKCWKDMAFTALAAVSMGMVAAFVPYDTVGIGIVLCLEAIAAAVACYKIYQSVKDKQGILHFGDLTLDNMKQQAKDNWHMWAIRGTVITLPTIVGLSLEHGLIGATVSVAVAMIVAGIHVYQNRDKWEEAEPNKDAPLNTRNVALFGAAALFPALAGTAMSAVTDNVAVGVLSIAASALIAVGITATMFRCKEQGAAAPAVVVV